MPWCNITPPKASALGFTPDVSDLPDEDWKYADVEYVYHRTSDLIRQIIEAAPILGGFKRTLIDVKVQDLTPEICSCQPGWHLDGKPFSDDLHHLVVLDGPLTEFIAEPVQYGQIPNSVKIQTIAPMAFNTFTSFDLHRGVHATEPCRRLLVRITETDHILAHNRPRKPSMGARR